MDVPTGVSVECLDGPCGQSRYVILDPANATITHVVVGEPEMFAATRLVPLNYVSEGSPELIRLKCTRAELAVLPQFSEYEHVGLEVPYPTYAASEFWMGPLAAYWPILYPKERQHVPKGELSIRRGERVEATDGHLGSVDEFLIEPVSGRITHLILRENHLWAHRDVVIPASAIDRIKQDTVFLKLNKEHIAALPSFRRGSKEAGMLRSSTPQADSIRANATDGPRSIQTLVAELGSSDRTTRESARLALASIGAPAVDALAAALASRATQVRWEAAKTLQQINDPAAAPALVATLEDPDFGVRWIAAEGLSALGRPGIVALLTALATKPVSPWLRNGAHHILRSLGDPILQEKVAAVLAATEDVEPSLEVPGAAHEALVALGELP